MVENAEKELPGVKGIMMNSHDIKPKYFGAFNQQVNQDHCLDQQEEELSKKLMTSKTGLKNVKRAVENISTIEKEFIQQHHQQQHPVIS